MSGEAGGGSGGPVPPTSGDAEDSSAVAEEDALFGAAADHKRVPPLPPSEQAAANNPGDLAIAEERSLSQNKSTEELAEEAAKNEHDRDQRFRDAFEIVAISSLFLGYVAIATVALIWAFHLVLPKELRWLSPEDLTHLQTFLTAGVLVGVVGNHFKRRLGDGEGK